MNILIIEDDVALAETIKLVFEKKILSNRIKLLHSYSSFLRELKVIDSYDIILVDIILGNKYKKTGIDVINVIRKRNKGIPIIIMSGLTEISRLEKGFNVGACDYINKPFRLKELEIRIYKWFKIYFYSDKSNNCKSLNYNGLIYNLEENQFYFKNDKLDLTKGNKYVLGIFISNSEAMLSERFLIEKIWGDIGFVIERNLRVVLFRLKKSLQKYGLDDRIQNIRGEGYILKQ